MNSNIDQQITLYLSGEMSAIDKASFEALMQQRPELAQQVKELQDQMEIEAYLEGSLDKERLKVFQYRILHEPGWVDKVQDQREFMRDLHMHEKMVRMKEMLAASAMPEPIPLRPVSWFQRNQPMLYGVAAALGLLILFVASQKFLKQSTPSSSEDLFATHFSPPVMPELPLEQSDLVSAETGSNLQSLWEEARKLHNQQRYAEARITLDSLAVNYYQYTDQILLWRAIGSLANGKYSEAQADLRFLERKQVSGSPIVEINWYLAMTYVALDSLEQASGYLTHLSQYPNEYQKTAKQMLTELNP